MVSNTDIITPCGEAKANNHRFDISLKYAKWLLPVLCLLLNGSTYAQGTWTGLTNLAPHYNSGVMLLLTDGTVLCKTSSGGTYGKAWDKLTPSATGSYAAGTWSSIDTMHDDRLYFSTQVLRDGRVYVAGGEYGIGGYKSEVYNPQTNTWTACPPVRPGPYSIIISDANSELLPDGRVLQAVVDTASARLNYIYNPTTNTYSSAATCLRVDNEASWVKLPDQSILFIDNYGTTSERYIPATNTWVNDATVPLSLYDAFGLEAGAAFLLPNGDAFFIGATNHTAYYHPSGTTAPGTWTSGPDIPSTQGSPDAAAAMMVNGKILMAVSPVPTADDHFPPPAAFYEFDYTTNTFTLLAAPGGGTSLTGTPCYVTNMLCLPNGQVLYSKQGSRQYYVYTPSGSPLTAGMPTVDTIMQASCNTFTATGTLFNGISEGAAYGDDWQMSSNYPIIRITSGSNIYYARSYNWNRTGVMTGTAADTVQFTTPTAITAGTYTLEVVANGIASAPHTFVVAPMTISPATASVCTGGAVTLTVSASGGTWSSSNPAVATVGSATGIVTGNAAGTATITYNTGSCTATRVVSVNASPTITTSTGAYCSGTIVTLTATPAGGTWSSNNSSAATVGSTSGVVTMVGFGSPTISYTVSTGCSGTRLLTINALPAAFTVTGGGSFCTGAGVAVGLSGSASSASYQLYNGSATVGSPVSGTTAALSFGLQSVAGTYTVRATSSTTGCQKGMTGSAVVIEGSPAPISGASAMCIGASVTLTDATTGGTWSSGNTAVATVGSSTGIVSGVASGTANITYTVGMSCSTSITVTVTASVSPVTGPSAVCKFTFTTFSNATAGGSWSSSNTSIATVGSTGIVHSLLPGTTTISYSISGCVATKIITVNNLPVITTPTGLTCVGGTGTFTVTPTGGYWNAENPASITIDSSTGAAVAVTSVGSFISYTLSSTGCTNFVVVDVNPLPAVFTVTGGGSYCSGAGVPIGLSGSAIAGLAVHYQLYNGSTAVGAPVTGTGSSISFGTQTAVGTYTVKATATSGGCQNNMAGSAVITSSVASISGPNTVCAGSSITLTDTSPGGTWSSSNTAVATVGSLTGVVTGVGPGTAIITYSTGASCNSSIIITVSATPTAYSVMGGGDFCAGSGGVPVGLSGSTPGVIYQLYSGATAVGSPVSGTGGAISFGMQTVAGTYTATATNSCVNNMSGSATVIVNAAPAVFAVTGGGTYCSGELGVSVGLAGSASGINYQLYIGGSPTGSPVTGTGTAISFGSFTTAGTYLVLATDATTACTSNMSGAASITVISAPQPISGPSTVCMGNTITLTDSATGGTWTSANASVATAGSSTGVVTAVSAGTVTINYTVGGTCSVSRIITVNVTPAAMTGPSTVSIGGTVTFSEAVTGGSFTSSSPSVADIDAATGVITGITAGSATITYTLPTGCYTTRSITVTGFTGISGTGTVCAGYTTTLTDSVSGGTWSSASPSVATVGLTSGIVTGISAGTAVISYNLGTSHTTTVVTVNATPPAAGGALNVCAGSAAMVTNSLSGGMWSSSAESIAIVDTATGIVTGVTAGSVILTYTMPTGCFKTVSFTVKPLPAAISGSSSICAGSSTTLTDVTPGGVSWMSSNPSVATIGSISGVVTGIATGTTIITYTLISGCYTTMVESVIPTPAAITGTSTICVAGTTTYSNADAGGTWSSSSATVATVGSSSGVVTGMFAGSAYITYTLSGCRAIRGITVNTTPAVITGTTTLCAGSTTTLMDATTGGAWSSDNTSIATVSSAGVVSGIAPGTATISYATAACYRAVVVTITPGVSAITGSAAICTGNTSALSNATTGGTWSSSNTAVATVSASGIVTGLTGGTATITYAISSGCRATLTVTVGTSLPAITGTATVIIGGTTTFSNIVTGGTWSSSNTAVATVSSSTGVVTGITTGTATITYSIASGCFSTRVVSVGVSSGTITGSLSVCVGGTSTLTDATPGGMSWGSSNTAVATVGATSGVVSGVAAGTAIITHYLSTGIYNTAIITVNALPAAITGTAATCAGSSTTLSSADMGGTWSSSNTAIATVGTSTGVVTGVAAGAAYIYYTLLGCSRAVTATVNALPVITGVTSVCNGSTAVLSSATTGGAWTSSDPSVATISGSGMVTGVVSGTSLISYTLATTGCTRTTTVTVGAISAITGNLNLCAGMGNILSNASTGGTWSSSNTAIATVTSAGIASGIAAGMATITYALSAGCRTTAVVTVSALPAAITGATSVCMNSSITLSDATSGGTWSSSNTALGTVDASGVVTGLSAGIPTISYVMSTGCYRTYNVTVKALPAAIVGNSSVCVGTSSTLTDPTSGGMSWTSSNTAVATIGATSGVLTGVSVGTAMITFTLATGCTATRVATVNPGISAGSITGPATVSLAASIASPVLYTDGVSGGIWSTSNAARATIGSSTGLLTGVSAGAVTVTYTVSNSCQSLSAIKAITITTPRAAGNEISNEQAIVQLYPNPTNGNFTLQSSAGGTLTVYTLEGKQVQQYQVATGTNTLSLPKSLSSGIYMCRYIGEYGSSVIIRLVYEPN